MIRISYSMQYQSHIVSFAISDEICKDRAAELIDLLVAKGTSSALGSVNCEQNEETLGFVKELINLAGTRTVG